MGSAQFDTVLIGSKVRLRSTSDGAVIELLGIDSIWHVQETFKQLPVLTAIQSFLAVPSSANLASAMLDETGSGTLVFGTAPTLNNPIITETVPWVTYNPTITSQTGTITTLSGVTGRYKQIGKTVVLAVVFTITNNGTGAGWINVSLPVNSQALLLGAAYGREHVVSGKMIQGKITSATNLLIVNYDNTYPGVTNGQIFLAMTYEAA